MGSMNLFSVAVSSHNCTTYNFEHVFRVVKTEIEIEKSYLHFRLLIIKSAALITICFRNSLVQRL